MENPYYPKQMLSMISLIIPMRITRIALLLVTSMIFQACCSCNDIGCFSTAFEMQFEAMTQSQGSFDAEDLQDLYLVRTQSDFSPIDSFQYDFGPTENPNVFRMIVSEWEFGLDGSGPHFKDFNYLLVNTRINQVDTLSDIGYNIRETRVSCNNCTGAFCSSDDLIERSYEDFSLLFNGETVDTTIVSYRKKP